MKKLIASITAAMIFTFGLASFSPNAMAEEKMVGVIKKIDIAGKEAKTATVTLKDTKSDKTVTVIVNDDLTLDKFKDHRINEGDEIRLKYEESDGKNVTKYFRKTAGC